MTPHGHKLAGAPHLLGREALRSVAGLMAAGLIGILFALVLLGMQPAPSPFVVLATAAALAGISAAVVAPRALLAVAIFLLPVVSITFLRGDLILPLVLVATIVSLRAPLPHVPYPIVIGVITFVSFNAVSLVRAPSPSRAVGFMVVTLFLYVGAFWFAGIFRDRSFARAAVKAYLWSCLFSALVGSLALHLHLPLSNLLLFGGDRARAFFKDPNDLGSYLVPAAAIVLEEIARPRLLGWSPRKLVVALALLLGGVVESFSRDAILNLALAFLVVLGVYALRKNGVRGMIRTLSVIVLCGVLGFGFLAATGSLDYFSKRSKAQSYDSQRFSNQAHALGESTRHFIGHGPGQAEVLLPLPTHSLYIRAFFEEGALGLAGTLLIVAGTLVAAAALAIRDADLHGIGSAALLGSWLGLAVAGFFVDTVHWRLPYLLMGFIWAATAAAPPARRRVSSA